MPVDPSDAAWKRPRPRAQSRTRRRPRAGHLLVAVLAVVVLGAIGLTVSPERSTAQPAPGRVLGQPVSAPAGSGAAAGAVRQAPDDGLTPARAPRVRPEPLGTGAATVRRLSLELRRRLDAAMKAASADGVRLSVTSGWRSPQEQERLIRFYTRQAGSRQAAYRWALPVADSLHVTGEAVDIGAGAGWLRTNGWRYGLCRRYRTEAWHFEMLVDPGTRCPALQDHPVALHP